MELLQSVKTDFPVYEKPLGKSVYFLAEDSHKNPIYSEVASNSKRVLVPIQPIGSNFDQIVARFIISIGINHCDPETVLHINDSKSLMRFFFFQAIIHPGDEEVFKQITHPSALFVTHGDCPKGTFIFLPAPEYLGFIPKTDESHAGAIILHPERIHVVKYSPASS